MKVEIEFTEGGPLHNIEIEFTEGGPLHRLRKNWITATTDHGEATLAVSGSGLSSPWLIVSVPTKDGKTRTFAADMRALLTAMINAAEQSVPRGTPISAADRNAGSGS